MNLEGINAINKEINELGGCYPPQPITNTLLDLLNSSYPTQPHSLIIAKYYYWSLSEQGFTLLASQEGISNYQTTYPKKFRRALYIIL